MLQGEDSTAKPEDSKIETLFHREWLESLTIEV
jgi:hypothetical protein